MKYRINHIVGMAVIAAGVWLGNIPAVQAAPTQELPKEIAQVSVLRQEKAGEDVFAPVLPNVGIVAKEADQPVLLADQENAPKVENVISEKEKQAAQEAAKAAMEAAEAAAKAAEEEAARAAEEAEKAAAESNLRDTIYQAAVSQLGWGQDCTMLATNALAAAGIHFHGWPADYLSLGYTVSAAEAQPGDLIYYADGGIGWAHIAVYAGDGQAVHGGWNGFGTVMASAYVGSGPVFIRVVK